MGFEQLAELKKRLEQEANAQRQQAKAQQQQKPAASKGAAGKGAPHKGAPHKGAPGKHTARPNQTAAKAPAKPPVDPVVHTIGKLQKRFPIAFPKNPAPKVALKIGILEDLLAQAGDLSLTEQEIRDAVATWCRGSRYWACINDGAPRVDLTGAEVGRVTASESAFARRRSTNRPKGAAKPGGSAPAASTAASTAASATPAADANAVANAVPAADVNAAANAAPVADESKPDATAPASTEGAAQAAAETHADAPVTSNDSAPAAE